jgi:hypothetical protein
VKLPLNTFDGVDLMQAVVLEGPRPKPVRRPRVVVERETGSPELSGSLSPRGLEILRVLNDVFDQPQVESTSSEEM